MANSTIKLNAPSHYTRVLLPQNADLDDYSDTGFFAWTWGSEGTIAHSPTNRVFTMIVVNKNQTLGSNQMILDNEGNIYYRVRWSTGWQAWRKVTTTAVT